MFEFAWPWICLILPLPLLIRIFTPTRNDAEGLSAPEVAFPHLERLKAAFPGQQITNTQASSRSYSTLIWLAWAALTLALMQPQIVDNFTKTKSAGHDVMLLVDLSGSMHALDFTLDGKRVNRLDIIQKIVGNFVRERQGDRVGLVLFGQHAYLEAPLTTDTLAVGKMLDDAAIGEAGDSTAIGDAIGVAVSNLRDRPGNSKVIVLLTDGADNASTIPPMQATKLAAQYGIRIYTIGIGSNGPVPIPDQNGTIVMAQMDLDENLLQQIADLSGGNYFRAAEPTPRSLAKGL